MSRTHSALIHAAIIVMAVLVLGMAYYLLGNHNCPLSRSFYLEKEIRGLHYSETHETVSSYEETAKRYREILKVIRFADTSEKLDHKYEEAIKRAELKAKICRLIDDYLDHQNQEALSAAYNRFTSSEYEELDPLFWIIHRNTRIHTGWFKEQLAWSDKR